jgi:mono/diheme cytochrome c family protein
MRPFAFPAVLLVAVALCGPSAWADTASGIGGTIQPLKDGAAVYKHVCQACHMADAKGAAGAGAGFPALAGNQKLKIASYPVYMILNGHGGMPWFSGLLTDRQIADVVNYIRTHFGNNYNDPVKAADVAAMNPHILLEAQ